MEIIHSRAKWFQHTQMTHQFPDSINFYNCNYHGLVVGALPQKWIFACGDCGCIFTTMAEKQTGLCPVCKSSDMDKIEGFKY